MKIPLRIIEEEAGPPVIYARQTFSENFSATPIEPGQI